jgi:hypothetical protein
MVLQYVTIITVKQYLIGQSWIVRIRIRSTARWVDENFTDTDTDPGSVSVSVDSKGGPQRGGWNESTQPNSDQLQKNPNTDIKRYYSTCTVSTLWQIQLLKA